MKNIGKPCAGEPHARFDEGGQARACSLLYPSILIVTLKNDRECNICFVVRFTPWQDEGDAQTINRAGRRRINANDETEYWALSNVPRRSRARERVK